MIKRFQLDAIDQNDSAGKKQNVDTSWIYNKTVLIKNFSWVFERNL